MPYDLSLTPSYSLVWKRKRKVCVRFDGCKARQLWKTDLFYDNFLIFDLSDRFKSHVTVGAKLKTEAQSL